MDDAALVLVDYDVPEFIRKTDNRGRRLQMEEQRAKNCFKVNKKRSSAAVITVGAATMVASHECKFLQANWRKSFFLSYIQRIEMYT